MNTSLFQKVLFKAALIKLLRIDILVDMTSLLRVHFRAPAARLLRPSISAVPRRFGSDYGGSQGGQEQGVNEKNPMKHLEHPGPEPPSTSSGGGAAATSDSPDSSSKDGASPQIHQPKSSSEDQSEDVRQHNEEMKNRAEKTSNQLGESDNKVDKEYWTGTVASSIGIFRENATNPT